MNRTPGRSRKKGEKKEIAHCEKERSAIISVVPQDDGQVCMECDRCKWNVRVGSNAGVIDVAGNMTRLCPLRSFSGKVPPHKADILTQEGKMLLPLG